MFFLKPPRHISTLPDSDFGTLNCLFRFTPMNGHRQTASAGPKSADSVEKVFLGRRTKFLRAADAFCARRRKGPYRFLQVPPTSALPPSTDIVRSAQQVRFVR